MKFSILKFKNIFLFIILIPSIAFSSGPTISYQKVPTFIYGKWRINLISKDIGGTVDLSADPLMVKAFGQTIILGKKIFESPEDSIFAKKGQYQNVQYTCWIRKYKFKAGKLIDDGYGEDTLAWIHSKGFSKDEAKFIKVNLGNNIGNFILEVTDKSELAYCWKADWAWVWLKKVK
jgi:hypothetical protein